MSLPKIDVATFETELPSNGKKIKCRPFLVKEEKILLMASESKDSKEILQSLNQILKNCILDDVDVENMAAFDAEHVFLKLREKSIGEIIQISVYDEDEKKRFESEIDLRNIKLIKNNKHSNRIKLSDKLYVEFKYPTLKTVLSIDLKKNDTENGLNIIINCLDKIYDSDTVYNIKDYSEKEIQEFLDSLTQTMYVKLNEFFDTMPSFVYESEVTSPYTNKKIKLKLENFIDFFI